MRASVQCTRNIQFGSRSRFRFQFWLLEERFRWFRFLVPVQFLGPVRGSEKRGLATNRSQNTANIVPWNLFLRGHRRKKGCSKEIWISSMGRISWRQPPLSANPFSKLLTLGGEGDFGGYNWDLIPWRWYKRQNNQTAGKCLRRVLK